MGFLAISSLGFDHSAFLFCIAQLEASGIYLQEGGHLQPWPRELSRPCITTVTVRLGYGSHDYRKEEPDALITAIMRPFPRA